MFLHNSRRILSLTCQNNRYIVRLKSGQPEKDLVDLSNIQIPKQYKGRNDPLSDGTSKIGEHTGLATCMTMLSQEDDESLYILNYSTEGFRLKSGVRIVGPTAFFPRHIFHWNVQRVEDINEDSLSLFTLLAPKLDILLLGVGMYGQKVSPQVIQYLRMKKINFEILPTDQACATFNFLNADKRWVAAAMIPPVHLPVFHKELEDVFTYDKFLEMDSTDDFGKDLGPPNLARAMGRVQNYMSGEAGMGEDAKVLFEDYKKMRDAKKEFVEIKKKGIERRKQERLLKQSSDTDKLDKK